MKLSPKAKASVDAVIARFQAGDLSPIVELAGIRRDPPVPFDAWSYRNRVLAYAQTDSTDLRGYKQWKEVERQVQKGTRGAYIFAPRVVKDKQTDEKRLAGWLTISVHPYHNTDGEPLPESSTILNEPPLLYSVAEALNISTKVMPNIPGALGDTDGKRIHLDCEDDAVWFHELAHALHRHLDGGKVKGDKAHRETVAEFTACVLMDLYGANRTGNAWRYISMFNTDPMKAIMDALGVVERILEYLFPAEKESEAS